MNRKEKFKEKKSNYTYGLVFGLVLISFFIYAVISGDWTAGSAGGSRYSLSPIFSGLLGIVLFYYSLRGLLKIRNREKLYKENHTTHSNHSKE